MKVTYPKRIELPFCRRKVVRKAKLRIRIKTLLGKKILLDQRPKALKATDPQPKGIQRDVLSPSLIIGLQRMAVLFGNGCIYTHDPVAKGKYHNCGSSSYMKPACTRPGEGAYDPEIGPRREKVKAKESLKAKRSQRPTYKTEEVLNPPLISHLAGVLVLAELVV